MFNFLAIFEGMKMFVAFVFWKLSMFRKDAYMKGNTMLPRPHFTKTVLTKLPKPQVYPFPLIIRVELEICLPSPNFILNFTSETESVEFLIKIV